MAAYHRRMTMVAYPTFGKGGAHAWRLGVTRAIRGAARLLAPAGPRGVLSILVFHRVLAQPDPLLPDVPDAGRFDSLLSWLGSVFNVVALDHAVAELRAGRTPDRALAITFDDGYADNYTVALPVLARHRMTATFFIACDYLDGGRMWNDTVMEAVRRCRSDALDLSQLGLGMLTASDVAAKRRSIDLLLSALKYLRPQEREDKSRAIAEVVGAPLPDDLMMTSSHVRALRAAGMQIGGHTRTHPILTCVDARAASDEIRGGKERLEAIVGERIGLFAYPNGKPGQDYGPAHVELVKAAYG